MPVLILAALVIAFLFWQLGRQAGAAPSRPGRCRWTATGNDNVSLGEYYCKSCKVTAYAQGGKPPQECKRSLRGGGL
ncbi:hypothetical protein [Yoonia sp. 2307UL14-13]|uniref:hypothetical protein n=1 Tax=Yoonia sp. 2307UL14-13 TaxID=3126506 RepID=UPI0030ACFEBC